MGRGGHAHEGETTGRPGAPGGGPGGATVGGDLDAQAGGRGRSRIAVPATEVAVRAIGRGARTPPRRPVVGGGVDGLALGQAGAWPVQTSTRPEGPVAASISPAGWPSGCAAPAVHAAPAGAVLGRYHALTETGPLSARIPARRERLPRVPLSRITSLTIVPLMSRTQSPSTV